MLIWREEILPSLLHQSYSSFSYIIFLRITPFLPNWFINLVSPVIGVRLAPFWIGTFLGVAPPSFVAIQAGTTLQKLTSSTDAITAWSVAMIVGFAILRYENHILLYFWLSILRTNCFPLPRSNWAVNYLYTIFICSIIPVILRRKLEDKFKWWMCWNLDSWTCLSNQKHLVINELVMVILKVYV